MNALIRKEVRLILPIWIVAALLAILPVWFFYPKFGGPHLLTEAFVPMPQVPGYAVFTPFGLGLPGYAVIAPFGLGLMMLCIAPFGREFSLGIFSMLLVQPVSRRRLWLVKIGTLACALVLLVAAFCLSNHFRVASVLDDEMRNFETRKVQTEDQFTAVHPQIIWSEIPRFAQAVRKAAMDRAIWTGSVLAALAFVGGLWTTLLFRQIGAALCFTFVVPMAITMPFAQWFKGPGGSGDAVMWSALLLLYSLAGFVGARWMFLRAQDWHWTGGTVSFPSWRPAVAEVPTSVRRRDPSPLRALIRKECQLHQGTLALAGALFLVHLGAVVLRKLGHNSANPNEVFDTMLRCLPPVWLILSLAIGGEAVAEERRLGTLESLLCLSVRRRRQFAVKAAVTLFWGIVLGGLMPVLIEKAGVWLGVSSWIFEGSDPFSRALVNFGACSATITLFAFYASTLTRGLLQAFGATILVGAAFLLASQRLIGFVVDVAELSPWCVPLLFQVSVPTMVAVFLALSCGNFKRLNIGLGTWLRNVLALVLALGFVFTIVPLIYCRAWELVLPMEPRHGSARLKGAVRPKICFGGDRAFVLLPDGRTWISGEVQFKPLNRYLPAERDGKKVQHWLQVPAPVSGMFLDSSNWAGLAVSSTQAIGLRWDGSLWRLGKIDPTNHSLDLKPERISSGTNWVVIAGAAEHFIAMNRTAGVTKEGEKKMDYSLVSWGPKLGSGPDPGQQRDYSAGYNVRDSKWQFVGVSAEEGQVLLSLEGALQNAAWHECEAHPDITGFPWLDRDRNGNLVEVHFRLAWGAGQKAGTPLWAILTPGGDLIPAKGYQGERWIWGRSRPSRYADWIAIGAQPISQPQSDLLEGARNQVWLDDVLVALAADGTLSAWQDPMQFLEPKCLCPTRRPIWSFNILAESR